jgi:hypothetical protein
VAEYQIVYWRDIPALVTAREGRRTRASANLPDRFQVAIDEAAMRAGLTGSDGYLAEWRRSEWQEAAGAVEELAQQMAADLDAAYPAERLRDLVAGQGRAA